MEDVLRRNTLPIESTRYTCVAHIRCRNLGRHFRQQNGFFQNSMRASRRVRNTHSCRARAEVRQHTFDLPAQVLALKGWLLSSRGVNANQIKLDASAGLYSSIEEFRVPESIQPGEIILELGADLGITATDAHADRSISELTEGRSELVCLALWLIQERSKNCQGESSEWQPFLQSLPLETDTPILWDEETCRNLLRGSPLVEEASSRSATLDSEWQSIAESISKSSLNYSSGVFNKEAFRKAMSVVFAHAAFLDGAQCFALLPIATLLKRTGREDAAILNFDLERQTATLTANRLYGKGDTVAMYDGRPNAELFLATGTVEDRNPSDCLSMKAELLKADRLYSSKKSIVESSGFSVTEDFPIYEDRMPLQLLAYMRLSRLTDPAQLAVVSFDRDTVISQNNEYEILQLMMSDCRERLSLYPGSIEDNVKKLQRQDLSRRDRLATKMVISEQRVLQGTVDALRRRLAPIRGIPTKSGGMSDPNEDLRGIFDTLENIPRAPGRLVSGILSWARGDQDPNWRKKGRKPPPNKRPW